MSIRRSRVSVDTNGAAGSASGNANFPDIILGEVLGIGINFHASAPATTDVTISADNPISFNVHGITNTSADVYIAPRAKPVDNVNTAIANAHAPFCVDGKVNVAVAQCDALSAAVAVDLWWRP